MRKNIFKVVLLLLVIFSCSSVYADDEGIYKHIYTIKNLTFSDGNINLEGYAFVSHMDNYGIKDGKGNLSNYLVAYTGDNVSLDNNGKCSTSGGGKCVAIQLTWKSSEPVDLYFARCNGKKCKEENGDYDRYKQVNSKKFSASKCNGNCMYYNVGFKDTIDIKKDLVEGLDENDSGILTSDIKFKIYSIILDDGVAKIHYSDFGVSNFACKVGKDKCKNNTEFDIGDGNYKIKVSGLSNMYIFDAVDAAAQTLNANGLLNKYTVNEKDFRFYHRTYVVGANEKKYTYEILGIDEKKRCIYKNDKSCFEDMIYKLGVFKTTKKYANDDWLLVPNTVEGKSGYSGEEDINNIWALANWGGKVAETFKITELVPSGPEYKELSCDDINKDKKNNVIGNIEITCDDDPTPNKEFYQCKRTENIEATIYMRINESDFDGYDKFKHANLNLLSEDGKTFSENTELGYLLPIKIGSAILFEETGEFHFANFSPKTVSAGKGFSINSSVANGISYSNTFRWLFGNVITKHVDSNYIGTPFISYSGGLPRCNNDKCVEDTIFVENALRNAFADPMDRSNRNKMFYYKDGGFYGASNTLNAVVYAIDEVLKLRYDTSKINNLKFKSCDSNSKTTACNKKYTLGSWNEQKNETKFIFGDEAISSDYKHRGFGKERSTSFEYQLPHAYIVLYDSIINGISYDIGDKIYSNEKNVVETDNIKYVGNKYFVGFKQAYDYDGGFDFPYYLEENNNISFVNGMNDWSIEAVCGVEVAPRTPPPEGGGGGSSCTAEKCDNFKFELPYKFRPISLSNPFPKGVVAKNWENWNNIDRIVNTEDYGVKYSINLSKFNVEGAIKIDEINSLSIGSYDQLYNYSSSGTSKFVEDYFKDRQGKNSYCSLGFFSSNCDRYGGIK